MGFYLDKSCEMGIRYRDVFLYCDICEVAPPKYATTRYWDSRRLSKKDGWIRKWSRKGRKFIDICPECQKGENHE